jgi:hypothetical protein
VSPHSDAEVVSELIKVAWGVFDDIAALGSAPAARKWSQPSIDARLKDGVITPYLSRHAPCLDSAARVITEVGDHVACVKVEVPGHHGDAPSFTWIISSRPHLLDLQGKEISVLREAAQSLRQGTREERTAAIRALDEISAKLSRAAPLDRVLGLPLIKSLRGLPKITVDATDPRGISDVLDLLEGITSFDVRYRDPGPNRLRPQDPDRLRFGIVPDGGLHVELKTPLGNYLRGVIPPERFKTEDARNQIIKHFTSLFASRTERDLFRLRSLIVEAAAVAPLTSDYKTRERRSTLQLPSTAHDTQNRAYEMAAELAKLYEVAGATVSLSSARVSFGALESCEITLSSDNRPLPTTMKLHVVPTGVRAIELTTMGVEGHEGAVIPLVPPLSPVTDAALLMTIFQRFKTLSRTPPVSLADARPTLRATPLYRYVHRLRPPESLLGYVRSFLARNSPFHGLFS